MPFSLTNAPTTFQVYINRALASLVDICYIVYLDNILVYSRENYKEYIKYIKKVLYKLKKYKLFLQKGKYKFYI